MLSNSLAPLIVLALLACVAVATEAVVSPGQYFLLSGGGITITRNNGTWDAAAVLRSATFSAQLGLVGTEQFSIVKTLVDRSGKHHIYLSQKNRNLQVINAGVIVHVRPTEDPNVGQVYSINGRVAPDTITNVPVYSPSQALHIALTDPACPLNYSNADIITPSGDLVYFISMARHRSEVSLAWEYQFSQNETETSVPLHSLLYMNAITGNYSGIVAKHGFLQVLKNITIWNGWSNLDKETTWWLEGKVDIYLTTCGPQPGAEINPFHDRSYDATLTLNNTIGDCICGIRHVPNSFNFPDKMEFVANYGTQKLSSFYDANTRKMYFGGGWNGPEQRNSMINNRQTLCHEVAHLINDYNDLLNANVDPTTDTQCIIESFGDVLGAIAEEYKLRPCAANSTPCDSKIYKIGYSVAEPLNMTCIHDMEDPENTNQNTYYYIKRIIGEGDTGILNLAFYLISQNGVKCHPHMNKYYSFLPRIAVEGIGFDIAANVWLNVYSYYTTSGAFSLAEFGETMAIASCDFDNSTLPPAKRGEVINALKAVMLLPLNWTIPAEYSWYCSATFTNHSSAPCLA